MKRGRNPLYPESKGEGLMGAYEEAALIDDSAETFGDAKKRRAGEGRGDREADLEFIGDVMRGKKEFDARDREIVGDERRRLRELRWRKKGGGDFAERVSEAEKGTKARDGEEEVGEFWEVLVRGIVIE